MQPPVTATAPTLAAPVARGRVGRNVILLGVTSLFTDLSSEMVTAVLPLYLTVSLSFTPLQFGVLDGLYHGVTALVRVVGGVLTDRLRRYKEVAVGGYLASALSKLGLLAVGAGWAGLAGLILVDRTGKGVRTAPRDALISLDTPPERLATAFGVHRALDTAGAMLGPLVAFVVLALAPGAFDAVFVVSFCAAVVGVGVLAAFVDGRPAVREVGGGASTVRLRTVVDIARQPGVRILLIAGTVLSLTTIGDAFIYLSLQRRLNLGLGFFPLLFVGTATVYLLLSVPAGRLADRVGRARVFVGGYLLLMGVYAALLDPGLNALGAAGCVLLLGAFYAATDGVLAALASAVLPEHVRTTGLALVTTATALARLVASIAFGALWTWWGGQQAIAAFLAGLVAACGLSAFLVLRGRTMGWG